MGEGVDATGWVELMLIPLIVAPILGPALVSRDAHFPVPRWPTIRASMLIGAGYLYTVGWIKWPASGLALACWASLGGLLILTGLYQLGSLSTGRATADRKRKARGKPQSAENEPPRYPLTARDLRRLEEHRRERQR